MSNGIFNREQLLQAATKPGKLWDVVVIGGGASGLGIALEAVTRGYQTLLVEQDDFAKGTSSRSTKLVHGGVRYLAQGNIALVREASIERGLLQKNAPHLVKNQTFIIPVYSFWDRIKYTIGLKLYDWIAGRLSLGPSVFISKKKTMEALPDIKQEGLVGGVQYHDGQFDDSRLALNLAQTIIEQGGVALNYVKVTGLIKNERGQPSGIIAEDQETAAVYRIHAKAVVNATGVFVDDILKMDNPSAPKSVVASQGVHLVLDKEFFSSPHALMIPETSDGRVLFAVPWHSEVVVGTTDTPVGAPSAEPRPLEKEIEFILNTSGQYLVKQPTRKDVLSVFAGLRPLAAPKEGTEKTKEISRSHKIIISPTRLFTIIGGKWTTYRKMGQDMVDAVEKRMGWAATQTQTRHLQVHGFAKGMDWNDPFYFYGSDAEKIKAASNGHWLSEKLKLNKAQLQWAVQQEMARTVEDFLARRTRALFLDAKESIRIAGETATLMAEELHKDKAWADAETERFTTLAKQYIL
ncbi:FAD-dependent oxidoreductase [Niabella ginsenosidivorans]|uniref:FAD-dependent oxidoreductase n=1 Tax=Niabella ginsenosidivorans TaxID=1176587 RepID=A0A1A9I6B5_9BACT|nr:glycerol-3-phosphate dehydrogenase/oxidase [Niabella ginsenosidivorans]ANH83218.1 FAD-dependent oxidoreductase [Niabella ginsenosidivorans]